MGRAIAAGVVLFAAAVFAEPPPGTSLRAQGTLSVSVRVVDAAKVDVVATPEVAQAHALKKSGSTEWVVPVRVSVDGNRSRASVELQGCDGSARFREGDRTGNSGKVASSPQIEAVVKNPACSPTVVVTVLPDGAPA